MGCCNNRTNSTLHVTQQRSKVSLYKRALQVSVKGGWGGRKQHKLPSTYFNVKYSSLTNICCCSLYNTQTNTIKIQKCYSVSPQVVTLFLKFKVSAKKRKTLQNSMAATVNKTAQYQLTSSSMLTGKPGVTQPPHHTPTHVLY